MAESYYIRVRGRVGGPFDEEKLQSLAQRGQLTRAHEVSEDKVSWFPAKDLVSVFPKKSAQLPGPAGSVGWAQNIFGPTPSSDGSSGNLSQWYYTASGVKHGPVSWQELRSHFATGESLESSLVWTDGMPEWASAASIPNLAPSSDPSEEGKPQIPWSELFPVARMLNDGAWTHPWVLCLATAVLFPLLVTEYTGKEDPGLFWIALGLSLYFSIIWTAFFHWCIAPTQIRAWRVVATWLLTATIGMVGVVIASLVLIPFFGDVFSSDSQASLLKKVIGMWVSVAVVEETAKLAPVILLARYATSRESPRTCMYFGVVSGLAFGTIEALSYTQAYVGVHSADAISYAKLVELLMLRWICLPLLHAVFTGIAGFFVGLSRHSRSGAFRWVALGVATSATLHALYNVGSGSENLTWLRVAMPALSISLFVGYLRSEAVLTRRVAGWRPRQPKPAGA